MVSLLEQAQEYSALCSKGKLSPSEELKASVFKSTLHENGVYSSADVDELRNDTESMGKRIAALKDKLENCRQRYDVYSDIAKTYGEISKGDYIGKLVEEEKQRREQATKKNKRKL